MDKSTPKFHILQDSVFLCVTTMSYRLLFEAVSDVRPPFGHQMAECTILTETLRLLQGTESSSVYPLWFQICLMPAEALFGGAH